MLKTAKRLKPREVPSAAKLTVSRPELLQDGSDQAFRKFVHDTLAFSSRIQDIRDSLARVIGLTGPQYTILIAIAREQGEKGVGINHIAEGLHLSAPFVTIEVKKLVAAKLVSKKTNPSDGRRVLLSITAKGRELLTELTAVQQPVNDVLFEPLSADDFARFRQKMSALVDSAGKALRLASFLSGR